MDPANDIFFWGNFLRYVKLDKFSEKKINYPTSQILENGDLNPNMSWLLAKNRKHKMFIRKCSEVIEPYENCINNKHWRLNIDRYIEEDVRRQCYLPWVQVRRCSNNYLGEDFTTFMEVARETNFAAKMQADRERQEYHEKLQKYKLQFWGPDHVVPAAEEGGEEESGEAEEE